MSPGRQPIAAWASVSPALLWTLAFFAVIKAEPMPFSTVPLVAALGAAVLTAVVRRLGRKLTR